MSASASPRDEFEEFGEYVESSDVYDYPHFTDNPENPLMESSTHSRWVGRLIEVIGSIHRELGSGALVCGNTPFLPPDGFPQTAPDLMVVAGLIDRHITRYVIGEGMPAPTVCVEVISESNTPAIIRRRCGRWLNAGVPEVYALDPLRSTFQRLRWRGDEFISTDALGVYSDGMHATMLLLDGELALCCAAGRPVRLTDQPYMWLADEQRRADTAELDARTERERADTEQARADTERARADELERRLRELGG